MSTTIDNVLIKVQKQAPGDSGYLSLRQLMNIINAYDVARLDSLEEEIDTADTGIKARMDELYSSGRSAGKVPALETAVGSAESGLVKDVASLLATQPTAGKPTLAVAATATLTASGNPANTDAVSIGGVTYAVKTELAAANDVLRGASASDTLDNLIAAVNKAAGEGTTYGTGTVANPLVTAAAGEGDTVLFTAKTAGTGGNAIVLSDTEGGGSLSWDRLEGYMAGGVNGTAATAGKALIDADNVYVATKTCTVSDTSGWKQLKYESGE